MPSGIGADHMYYIYILKCSDDTLYTGYTTDLKKRLDTHNSGRGAKYTRSRLPVELVYHEEFEDKIQAFKREYEIKKLGRTDKLKLLEDDVK